MSRTSFQKRRWLRQERARRRSDLAPVALEKFGAPVVGTTLLGLVAGLPLVLEGRLAGLTLLVGDVAAAMSHMTLLALVFGALAAATWPRDRPSMSIPRAR